MKPPADLLSEARDFIKSMPLFRDLSEPSLLALAQSGKFISIKKGQCVFYQSDPADKVFLLRSGLISIVLESPDGREMVINEMHPCDIFGEVGVLTGQSRSTSAFARADSEILTLTRQAFLSTIDAEPVLARRMLELTANRLRGSSERESALAFLDAQARLARLLLQLEKQAPDKGYVTISQEELAQRTGQTRQTVAKALGRWRRAGWLLTGRGHIMLLRQEAFAQLEHEWKF
ncbi:MAG TPA: Crp/Fnr family transcriptional regulator [Anaerolineales bacterium]|nr:Crp/Fnr family transcriptional regulator [Anaerolineales bacterium]